MTLPDEELETPVPSPCVNICTINRVSGLCDGCLRSLDEIAAWSTLDDTGKRAIWVALRSRGGVDGVRNGVADDLKIDSESSF